MWSRQKQPKLQNIAAVIAQVFIVFSAILFQLAAPAQVLAQSGGQYREFEASQAPQTTTSRGGQTPQAEHPIKSCSVSLTNIDTCIAGIFYVLFIDLTAPVVFIAGRFLDYTVALALDSSTYSSNMIQQGWTVARDLANMAFVFVLIYIALRSILNIEGVMSSKILGKVLAVALVINFSFFFTRVVIDATNILAFQFYKQVPQVTQTTVPGLNRLASERIQTSVNVRDLSQSIMAGVGVQQVLQDKNFVTYVRALSGGFGSFMIQAILYIAFGVLNILLAFVFFYSAFQFIGRIVGLWLAIIASPLGFLGFAIPQLGELSGKWWDGLIKNAIYAPVFFFLMYLVLIVVESGSLTLILQDASSADTTNTISGIYTFVVKLFIQVGILVGLLVAVLKAADKSGTVGSSFVKGVAQNITGKYVSGYSGLWRGSAGRLGYMAAQSNWLRDAAANNAVAGAALRGANYVSKASFDVRNIKSSGIENVAGKGGGKDGYTGVIHNREKAIEEQGKLLKTQDHEKYHAEQHVREEKDASGLTYEERKDSAKARFESSGGEERLKKLDKEAAAQAEALRAAQKAYEDAVSADMKQTSEVTKAAMLNAEAKMERVQKEKEASEKATGAERTTLREDKDFLDVYDKRIKKASKEVEDEGKNRTKAYAKLLENRGALNPIWWGTNTYGTEEGAMKLRKSLEEKSKKDKIMDAIKDGMKEDEKKDDHGGDHKEEKGGGDHGHAPAPKAAAAPKPAAKADDHGHH